MENNSIFEQLYNLIPRDQLIEYIESNDKIMKIIIKSLNNRHIIESMSDIPVIILTKSPSGTFKIRKCEGSIREELLLWWYNTQKFAGLKELSENNRDYGFRRYPLYLHEPLHILLGTRLKRGTSIQRNNRVYFVEDISFFSSRCEEINFRESIDEIKRTYWPNIYENDPDIIEPVVHYRIRADISRRIKPGIECEDIWSV